MKGRANNYFNGSINAVSTLPKLLYCVVREGEGGVQGESKGEDQGQYEESIHFCGQ